MDTSTPATNIPTPPTNTPSPSAVATSSIIPSSPIPATPQGAPVSTDPLDSMKASITSQLKAQNAPQSDIDKAMGLVDDQWGNYQYEQANQGVAGTGFGKTMINNAIDSGTQTAGTFAAAPQTTAGVMMPVNPGDTGIGGVGKMAANAVSDTWGIATSLAGLLNPLNWPKVVGSILSDPASLVGPFWEQEFYGANNAISDLISGQPGKIWSDLDNGTQKAVISFMNHPVSSILAPMMLLEGVGDVTDLATDAEKTIPGTKGTPYEGYTTSAQTLARTSIYNAANFVSESIAHPIETINNVASGLYNPVKGIFSNMTKSGLQATVKASLAKIVGSYSGIDGIDKIISTRPDYSSLYAQLGELKDAANEAGPTTEQLSGFLKNLQGNVPPEFADLIRQRDILGQSIINGKVSMQKFGVVSANTLREIAESRGKTTDEMKDSMMNQGLSLSGDAKGFYEKNLNDKAGNPIPVDSTPAINAYNDFIKRTNPSTSADENVTLRNQRDELVLRQALSEANGNLTKASNIIQEKFGGLRSSDNYTSPLEGVSVPEGMSPDSLRSINWSKIDSSYYQGLSASGLKAVSSRFQNLDIAKMGKSGAIGKAYGDIIEPAINQALKDAVNSVNPSGWKAVQSADALWAKFKINAKRFGLEGGDASKVSDAVFAEGKALPITDIKSPGNWNTFKQAYPDLVGQAQQLRLSQILADAIDPHESTGEATLDVDKLGNSVADNMRILDPSDIKNLNGVIQANQFGNGIIESGKATAKSLADQMQTVKESSGISPSDNVAFEMKARNVGSLKQLQQLSAESGLSAEDIGKTAVYSIIQEASSKISNNTGFTIEDAKTILGEFDKIGQGADSQLVIDQMFPKTNGSNAIRQTIDDTRALVNEAGNLSGKRWYSRAISLAIGGILGATGHTFMGIGFLRRGITSGAKTDIDVGGIKTATTEGFEPPVKPPGIVSKTASGASKVVKAGGLGIGSIIQSAQNQKK